MEALTWTIFGSAHLPNNKINLSHNGLQQIPQECVEAKANLVGDGLTDVNIDAEDVKFL